MNEENIVEAIKLLMSSLKKLDTWQYNQLLDSLKPDIERRMNALSYQKAYYHKRIKASRA